MVPIFSIASVGGSASHWLTSLLNRHPAITCYHALRSDPFSGSDGELPPRLLAAGLAKLQALTHAESSIGIVHSVPDHRLDGAFTEFDGRTALMVRRPLERIHSLFTHHYEHFLGLTLDGDIYETALAREEIETLDGQEPVSAAPHCATKVEDKFRTLCDDVVGSDLTNYRTVPLTRTLVFERLFEDEEHLFSVLEAVIGPETADLRPHWREQRRVTKNKHAQDSDADSEQVFARWPEKFKRIFVATLVKFGVQKFFDSQAYYDYAVPDGLQSYLDVVTPALLDDLNRALATEPGQVVAAFFQGQVADYENRVAVQEEVIAGQERKVEDLLRQNVALMKRPDDPDR